MRHHSIQSSILDYKHSHGTYFDVLPCEDRESRHRQHASSLLRRRHLNEVHFHATQLANRLTDFTTNQRRALDAPAEAREVLIWTMRECDPNRVEVRLLRH